MTWPTPGNFTGLREMFIYVDTTISGGLFSLLMVMSIFIISFAAVIMGGLSTSKSFIFSSFLTFAIASIFWGAGIVQGKIIVILLVMLVFSFVYHYIAQR